MGDRLGGRQRRKLYKPPPPSSCSPFQQNSLLDDEAASSTDLARISALMNQIHRSSPSLSDDSRKHVLSQPLIRSPSPEQASFTLNPSVVTVVPNQQQVSPFFPESLDGSTGYGYGAQNALYDSYMRTAVGPMHVPDPPLSCPNSHSSAESSTMARSPTNLHSRSRKSVPGSASTSHIIRRWSMLHVPDETLAVELEQLRRITRIRQRKKSEKAKSSLTCNTLERPGASPSGACSDQIRFPTKDDYAVNDGTHAHATLSGAFVYGGPELRQKFWLVDDDDDARSDEDDISDPSDDDSDTPEDDPQTPPDVEEHQEQAWKLAREALFCCRELVRTEKTYFSKLVQLKDGQVILFTHHFLPLSDHSIRCADPDAAAVSPYVISARSYPCLQYTPGPLFPGPDRLWNQYSFSSFFCPIGTRACRVLWYRWRCICHQTLKQAKAGEESEVFCRCR